jgi:predicted nucleic acid-binding protein
MSVFVDTSALYALLDEDDIHHADASDTLRRLVGAELLTHAYVIVEAAALVGRRLPWAATERLLDGILAAVDAHAVDADVHASALGAYRASQSAAISLVDRTSFAFMRARGIQRAFAYDDDFVREGFELEA